MTHLWHMITHKPPELSLIVKGLHSSAWQKADRLARLGESGGVAAVGFGGRGGVETNNKQKKTKQQTCFFPLGGGVEAGFRGEAAILWLVGGPHTFSVTMVTALPRADFQRHPRGRRLIEWLSGCETCADVWQRRTLTDTLHTEAGSPGQQEAFCCMRHVCTCATAACFM